MEIKRTKKSRKTLADVAPGEVFYFCDDENENLYLKTDIEHHHVGLEDGELWYCNTDEGESRKSVIVVSAYLTVKE